MYMKAANAKCHSASGAPSRTQRVRVQLHIANDHVKNFTRRGLDWMKRFKKIAADA